MSSSVSVTTLQGILCEDLRTRRRGRGTQTYPGHDVVVQAVHEVHELHPQEEHTVNALSHWLLGRSERGSRVPLT